MSTIDSDVKKLAEQAASYVLHASFLKVPQAMRAVGFSDEDASNVAKQMHVRRAMQRLKQRQTKALPVGHSLCPISLANRNNQLYFVVECDHTCTIFYGIAVR